ncbi:MAG: hypothetical protein ACOC4K_00385 [Verrucomicrobiota bacterium]
MNTETEIPAKLDTPAFREAWAEWEAHRRETGKKLTPRSARMAVKRMALWGPERAVAAIEYSIAQGYRGVFEEPGSNRELKTGQPGNRAKPMSLWEIQEREKALRNELDSISSNYFGPDADRVNAERREKRTKIAAKLRELKTLKLGLDQ